MMTIDYDEITFSKIKELRAEKLEQKIRERIIDKYEFKELYKLQGFSNEFANESWETYKRKLLKIQ